MVNIINLNQCPLSRKNGMYGGADGSKEGIVYNGAYWLLKYPKNIAGLERTGNASYSTSPLSEFIGSHVYSILGYDVHETFLAERFGKLVVACKDFAVDKDLLEIRTIKNYANIYLSEILERDLSSTGSDHCINFEELLLHLENNPILQKVPQIQNRFWEQAVVDILLNNNDRNNGNWGILRDAAGVDTLAPIFDNGACFQTKISESKIERILSNEKLAKINALNIQTTYGSGGHNLSATQFLDLYTEFPLLRSAILKVVPNIQKHLNEFCEFIESIPEKYTLSDGKEIIVCSKGRKQLFILQLRTRFDDLLLPYFQKVIQMSNP